MSIPRFFAPSVAARLFDPMPLPLAARRRVRIGVDRTLGGRPALSMAFSFARRVKKVPMYR